MRLYHATQEPGCRVVSKFRYSAIFPYWVVSLNRGVLRTPPELCATPAPEMHPSGAPRSPERFGVGVRHHQDIIVADILRDHRDEFHDSPYE